MSLRPIDFQTMVPKVSERTRTQNEDQQRSVSQQQQQAEAVMRGAQEKTGIVQHQDDAQKADIHDEESKKNKKDKKLARQTPEDVDEKKSAQKKLDQPAEGRTIDIRI